MSATDLIFAFVSLLLGLGVAEVLGGFARAIAAHRAVGTSVRVGWLTPLVALFVILDLTSFWHLAYEFRDQFRATYPMLVGVLAICGLYYIVAALVFPADLTEWGDLDDHYVRQKRVLLGGVLAANLTQVVGQVVVEILVPTPAATETASDAAMLVEGLAGLGILTLLIATLVVRSRRANRWMLTGMIALLLGGGTIAAGL